MIKKSNIKRYTSGSSKGKKGISPHKYYMDKDKIIAKRIDDDAISLFMENEQNEEQWRLATEKAVGL